MNEGALGGRSATLPSIRAINFDYSNIASTETDGDDVYYASGFGGQVGLGDGDDRFFGDLGDDFATASSGLNVFNGEGGNDTLNGGDDPDIINGGSGDDSLTGGAGSDTLTGGPGDDFISGGFNSSSTTADTAVINADFGALTISLMNRTSNFMVTDRLGNEGTDAYSFMAFLQTNDFTLDMSKVRSAAFASDEEITQIAELYLAYFDRAPDSFGLIFWIDAFRNSQDNFSLKDIAEFFFDQPETRALYDTIGEDVFVQTIYQNVFGRDPDAPGLAFWSSQLSAGTVTRADFILELLAGARANPDGAADVAFIEDKVDLGIYFALIQGQSNTTAARNVMDTYDGSASSLEAARSLSDTLFVDAQTADDAVLMPLVGVIDDPFAVA